MVNGKFSPGNFSGTKWAREVSGGNLLHPDTFSDFPEPHPAVPCSGKFIRLFLMATWKSGLGNFSGTNLSHVTMGGNLLH